MERKTFDYYLQEALREFEKENCDVEKCKKLFTKAVKVAISNDSEEVIEVEASSPEEALAKALSALTPGVKTIVAEA